MKIARIVIGALILASNVVCCVSAQPVVSAVLNAASYSALVSPGCVVAIFGSSLADAPVTAPRLPLSTELGSVTVSVAGLPAPLFYVSPSQINALIPVETAIPANTVVPLVVTAPGGSITYNIRLTRNAPGIFTRNAAGTGRNSAESISCTDGPGCVFWLRRLIRVWLESRSGASLMLAVLPRSAPPC